MTDMKYRKLRIAWSVGCGILCVLLIALWVRSYWYRDRLEIPLFGSRLINAWSMQGQLTAINLAHTGDWRFTTTHLDEWVNTSRKWKFNIGGVHCSHFFPASILGFLAASPWLPWRFSLGTLLIGLTVVAVILGAVIYAVK
jgi:hypothetical protein